MRHAQCFCSAHSCGNWYSVDLSSSGHLRLGLHAHWDDHTLGLHTSWPRRPLLLLCLRPLEHFLLLLRLWLLLHLRLLLCTLLHALLLLCTMSSSSCLSGLSLVLEHPWSQFSHPSFGAWSRINLHEALSSTHDQFCSIWSVPTNG